LQDQTGIERFRGVQVENIQTMLREPKLLLFLYAP